MDTVVRAAAVNKEPKTQKQAMARARKLFGKTAGVTFRTDGPVEADRVKYRAMGKPEQEAYKKEHGHPLLLFRCTVGKMVDVCGIPMFLVRGQGDTWAEAFAKVQPE
jgi:hypothetical protein